MQYLRDAKARWVLGRERVKVYTEPLPSARLPLSVPYQMGRVFYSPRGRPTVDFDDGGQAVFWPGCFSRYVEVVGEERENRS